MSEQEYQVKVSAADAQRAARQERFTEGKYFVVLQQLSTAVSAANGHLMLRARLRALTDPSDSTSTIGPGLMASVCLPLRNPDREGHEPHGMFFDTTRQFLTALIDEPFKFVGNFKEDEDDSFEYIDDDGEFEAVLYDAPAFDKSKNSWSYRGKTITTAQRDVIKGKLHMRAAKIAAALYYVPINLDLLLQRGLYVNLSYRPDSDFPSLDGWARSDVDGTAKFDPTTMLEEPEIIIDDYDIDSLESGDDAVVTVSASKAASKSKSKAKGK